MKVPQGQEIYVGGKRYVAGQELPDGIIKQETEPVMVAKKAKVTDEPAKFSGE